MTPVEHAAPTDADPAGPLTDLGGEGHRAFPLALADIAQRAFPAPPAPGPADAAPPVAPADEAVFTATSPSTGAPSPAALTERPGGAAPVRRTPAPAAARARAWAARRTVDWTSWATTSLLLAGFFVLVVSGRVVTEGPVVLVLTATHGIHLGDLFALAGACTGIAAPLLPLLRRVPR